GPLRSVTLGQRIFTGVIVGFVFRILQDLLGPASQVFGFSPLLAVVVPAGLCALAGAWLLKRAGETVRGLARPRVPFSNARPVMGRRAAGCQRWQILTVLSIG